MDENSFEHFVEHVPSIRKNFKLCHKLSVIRPIIRLIGHQRPHYNPSQLRN